MGVDISLLTQENEGYVEWQVNHGDGTSGGIDLRIMELCDTHFMQSELHNAGVPTGSAVAEFFFYPHSKTSEQNRGIGSEVLEYLLREAKQRGVAAVYCEATNLKAKEFFRKRGFQGSLEPHGYRIL